MPSGDVSRSRKRKASLSPGDPVTASPNGNVPTAILAAEPIGSGDEMDFLKLGMTRIDAHRLRGRRTKPSHRFLVLRPASVNKEPRHVDR
jgi:hypothetical protein